MAEQIVKQREDINSQYKWAIEDLYAEDAAWERDYHKVLKMAEKIKAYQGKLSQGADTLYKFMQKYEEMEKLSEKVYVYANQRLHENTGNAIYQGLVAKAQNMMVSIGEAVSFFEPELLAIPEDIYQEMIQNKRLRPYEHYFAETRRQRTHILTREMEELLALSAEVTEGPQEIFSMFNNADIKFPEVRGAKGELLPLTHATYIALLENSNRSIREQAFKNLYGIYEKNKNMLAAVYQASVKADVFQAKARKYNSAREMALDASNIPLSVYDNLIESVHAHLPAMYQYIDIRGEALGIRRLHMYDLYAPMVDDVDMKKDFEEAKKIVVKGLEPLGGEYITILKEGFENRWIDIYENVGKRSGAYSWGAYGTHPYVLLNYNGTLNHVFTLAHEMGHALHSFYSDANQDYIYAGYKIFVAEVASTVNESLLIHYLIAHAKNAREKAYLINHFLEQFRGTLFRQTMFAEFEKITHEMVEHSEALTAEGLCKIYFDLNKKYFGENIHVDSAIAMEWARIPHFYTAFYVYQYATGFSAAIAISKAILAGDEEVKKGYFKFLKSGSSMYPIDLLKLCKVDMTTTKPVEDALKVFEGLLEDFKEVMKECK